MKKILCLLLWSSMVFLTSCSYAAGKNDAETINKDVVSTDTKISGVIDQKISPSDIQKKADAEKKADIENKDRQKAEENKQSEESDIEDNKDNNAQTPGVSAVKGVSVGYSENHKGLWATFYYQDGEGNIVPVSRKIEKGETVARGAVMGIIDNAGNREEVERYGLYPVLPKETEVLGINVVQGVASIDFNNKLLEYKTKSAEKNIIASIVYTLTQFQTINSVKILINGRSYKKFKFDTDVSGILSRDNILVNSDKINLEPGKDKSDVYLFKYYNDQSSYIIPVSVEHDIIKYEEKPAKIVELLVKDYSGKKLSSLLSPKSKLIESNINGSLLTINFNSEIRNYGGSTREEAIVKQILYSMKQVKGIDRLKVLIEGKEAILPEGTELEGEISIPNNINEINEE